MDINKLSNRTVFRILADISIFIGLLVLAYLVRRQLVWLVIAFFLALALEQPVRKLSRYMPRKSRGLAAGLMFLILVSLLGLLIYTLVPPLIHQTQSFLNDLPGGIDRMRNSNNTFVQSLGNSDFLSEIRSANQSELIGRLSGVGSSVLDVIRGLFGSVIATITVLVLTVFMIIEGPRWVDLAWQLQPASKREERRQLAGKMAKVVTSYTNGRLLISSIAAITSILVMTLAGVPYSIPLGIIVGIFGLMPLIGATLGAVVVVTVALVNSLTSAVIMTIFFIIYQQFENTIIQPLVDSKTVQLSPLTALISALLGISLGGILGALLAIPVGACIQILLKEYAAKRSKRA